MIDIRFTLTPAITTHLPIIDQKRKEILSTPIPAPILRSLQWQTMVNRLENYLLANNSNFYNHQSIEHLLSHAVKLPLNHPLQMLLNYRTVQTWISEEWYATGRPITLDTLDTLSRILTIRIKKFSVGNRIEYDDLKNIIEYTTSKREHPIITAAILFSQFSANLFSNPLHPFPLLLTYLVLSKDGFELYKLLNLEKLVMKHSQEFQASVNESKNNGTITPLIELFIQTLASAEFDIENMIKIALSEHEITKHAKRGKISDREKAILELLMNPQMTITNREVQKHFKISQITASRDLANLTKHGLLFSHGQGRSIYYTKI